VHAAVLLPLPDFWLHRWRHVVHESLLFAHSQYVSKISIAATDVAWIDDTGQTPRKVWSDESST
jgi:hypothetical protein